MTPSPAVVAHDAYRNGDLAALRAVLGNPVDFPNCIQPENLGVSRYPLASAIDWSPVSFIAALLDLGADPNYPDESGFPSLISTLSPGRQDGIEVLQLLLERGADVMQRGLNDWTPLHTAVAHKDGEAVKILLRYGANPMTRTRIDDYSTPLEDAETVQWPEGAALLRETEDRVK